VKYGKDNGKPWRRHYFTVRAVLAKSISEGGGKSPEELELAVR
jgi:hypothetical protein